MSILSRLAAFAFGVLLCPAGAHAQESATHPIVVPEVVRAWIPGAPERGAYGLLLHEGVAPGGGWFSGTADQGFFVLVTELPPRSRGRDPRSLLSHVLEQTAALQEWKVEGYTASTFKGRPSAGALLVGQDVRITTVTVFTGTHVVTLGASLVEGGPTALESRFFAAPEILPAPAPKPVASPRSLSVGSTVTTTYSDEKVAAGRPHDEYTFTGRAGQTIELNLSSPRFLPRVASLQLIGPLEASEPQFSDEASASDETLKLEVELPADGTYLVRTRPLRLSGDYSLKLTSK